MKKTSTRHALTPLASVALAGLTGCSMFSAAPPRAASPAAPTTQPDLASATDVDRKIEELFGRPGERKNVPLNKLIGDAPIARTVLPGAPATMPARPATTQSMPSTVSSMGTAASSAANASSADMAAAGTDPTMEQLMSMLRKRVQSSPKSINEALALQLLEMGEAGKTEDLTALGISINDGKMLTDLAAAVQAVSASPTTPTTTLADRSAPLLKAARSWETTAPIKLPKMALASRVDSFGVYTPVEPRFPAGKRSVVIIYCEVQNFSSEKSEEFFVTHLTQQDTLVADDGLIAWRSNPEEVEDRCRNQRHDFYLIKKLTLPETLPIGTYKLRMTVTDKTGNKTDTAIMEVDIVK